MTLALTSGAFTNNSDIPADYTCNGREVSPPLKISGVSDKAKSLVLILDDPDAAKEPAGNGTTFDHWILYNIPPVDQEIAEGSTPNGSELGKNSEGSGTYIGPCPPTFRHAYFFRLLELDCKLSFDSPPTKAEVEKAAQGHVINEVTLTSYYEQPHK